MATVPVVGLRFVHGSPSVAVTGLLFPGTIPRLTELTAAIRELAPQYLQPVFLVVTQLGGSGFFLLALALLYWLGDREYAVFLVGVTIGALALTEALKYQFALPRPEVAADPLYARGYGFPSGHALGSTVFYGVLAVVSDVGRRRWRLLAAAALVTVVGLSRVVLGAHYVGDVLAGIAIGVVYLGGFLTVVRTDPERAVTLGALVGLAGVVVAGAVVQAAAVAGVGVGTAATWYAVRGRIPTEDRRSRRRDLAVTVVGTPVVAALGYLARLGTDSVLVALAAAFLLAVVVLGLPVVAGREASPS